MNSASLKKSILGFTVLGVLLGMTFPAIAYFILSLENQLEINLSNIIFLHKKSVLLYIIDLAPIVIGLLFAIIGKYYATREEYLIAISKLEKELRTTDHVNAQKQAIRRIRIAYTSTFMGVAVMLIILAFLVLEMTKSQQEGERFRSDIKSQLVLTELKKHDVSNDILLHNGYYTNIIDYLEKQDEPWYQAKLAAIQSINSSDQGIDELVQQLDGLYYFTYSESLKKNQIILIIGILIILMVVILFIYTHFFIFFPTFVELQKGILETTFIKNKLEVNSIALESALKDNEYLLSELNKNLLNAEAFQKINRKNLGELRTVFNEVFIINKPLQILSGDFIWHQSLSNSNQLIVMGDCVGHGVAASLLSNFYFKFLDHHSSHYLNPHQFYKEVQKSVNSFFTGVKHEIDTECEMTIIEIDTNSKKIKAFSTQMELYLVEKNEVSTIQFRFSDSQSLEDKNTELDFTTGKELYIATDGLRNSFSQESKRVGRKGVASILSEVSIQPSMTERRLKLKSILQSLQSNDDILVLGISL